MLRAAGVWRLANGLAKHRAILVLLLPGMVEKALRAGIPHAYVVRIQRNEFRGNKPESHVCVTAGEEGRRNECIFR